MTTPNDAPRPADAPPPQAAGGAGAATILKTDRCTIRFGGLIAVNTLDMAVQPGEIYGLIGPNGAGKTTIFNLLTGVYEPTDGERSEEHTSELQSLAYLVCRLLLEKKKKKQKRRNEQE